MSILINPTVNIYLAKTSPISNIHLFSDEDAGSGVKKWLLRIAKKRDAGVCSRSALEWLTKLVFIHRIHKKLKPRYVDDILAAFDNKQDLLNF